MKRIKFTLVALICALVAAVAQAYPEETGIRIGCEPFCININFSQ